MGGAFDMPIVIMMRKNDVCIWGGYVAIGY